MWMVGDGFDSAIGCVEEGAGVASMGGLSLKAREVRAMALGLINSDKGWRSPGVGAPGYEERTEGGSAVRSVGPEAFHLSFDDD